MTPPCRPRGRRSSNESCASSGSERPSRPCTCRYHAHHATRARPTLATALQRTRFRCSERRRTWVDRSRRASRLLCRPRPAQARHDPLPPALADADATTVLQQDVELAAIAADELTDTLDVDDRAPM